MPKLSDHQSNDFTKLLLIGDAKSGKTGSLVSLVKAGYKLRILDMVLLVVASGLLLRAEAMPVKIATSSQLVSMNS